MKTGNVYIGLPNRTELITPFGRTIDVEVNEFSRSERTANKRLVRDIIAVKRKFTIKFSEIEETNLQKFIDLYNLFSELHFTYENTTYTVLMDPFDYSNMVRAYESIYKGVSIVLNEV